jgi:drug/metabolite transporter (DMT)-like permease
LEVVYPERRVGLLSVHAGLQQGCETVSSATGSVVLATAPVLTALMARFIHGETLRPHQWAAMAVEFVCVALQTLMNGAF